MKIAEAVFFAFFSCLSVPALSGEPGPGANQGDFPRTIQLDDASGKYYLADRRGKALTPRKYDSISTFSDLFFNATIGKKHCLLDSQGKELTPIKYDSLTFLGGSPSVLAAELNNKFCLIDQRGKELTPFKYDSIRGMYGAYSAAEVDKKYCLLDPRGKELTPFTYDGIDQFILDRYFRAYKEFKVGVIDIQGKEILPVIYDSIGGDSTSGLATRSDVIIAELDEKYGCVNAQGKEIVPFHHDRIWFFNDKYLAVWQGALSTITAGKIGLLDLQGRTVFEPEFQELIFFNPAAGEALFWNFYAGSPTENLIYVYTDGEKLKYVENWESMDLAQLRFPRQTGYVYADTADLRAEPIAESEPTGVLKTGTEVDILSYGNRFYRDGSADIKTLLESNDAYFSEREIKLTVRDRWVKVKVAGAKTEGYTWESLLTRNGLNDDLDNDGKKELLLLKTLSYDRCESGGEEGMFTVSRDKRLIGIRVLRGRSLVNQSTLADFSQPLKIDAAYFDYHVADVDFIKVPANQPKLRFLVLAWEYGNGDYMEGNHTVRAFYYFKNGRFNHVDTEYSGGSRGSSGTTSKEITYDEKRKTAVMKETQYYGDEESAYETFRQYYWDVRQARFILEQEKLIRKVESAAQ